MDFDAGSTSIHEPAWAARPPDIVPIHACLTSPPLDAGCRHYPHSFQKYNAPNAQASPTSRCSSAEEWPPSGSPGKRRLMEEAQNSNSKISWMKPTAAATLKSQVTSSTGMGPEQELADGSVQIVDDARPRVAKWLVLAHAPIPVGASRLATCVWPSMIKIVDDSLP